ncbi:hypothetical protein [Xanthomonas bundabergensis]|uniref:hypothetical protein n=1 Tax=Xanthomonas bundabergensis TaxID=3160842 RepID=UPI003514AFEE
MTTTTLYAWVNPVGAGDTGFIQQAPRLSALVDHTWVTSYDNREHAYPTIQDVLAQQQQYWYCWGVFHPSGQSKTSPGGYAGQAQADLAHASCLCLPNQASNDNPPAQGTIFRYAINGVCHQLANQVLWATGSASTAPLTVRIARGYWLSTALYGTYGRNWLSNAWEEKKNACAVGAALVAAHESDDFAARVHATLGEALTAAARDGVLQFREAAVAKIAAIAARETLRADAATTQAEGAEINRIALEFQDNAAKALDPEQYRQIFELDPDERLTVVDPAMLA